MSPPNAKLANKIPAVTLVFWLIKIMATTLGETGGDAVSMSLDLGYLLSSGIFLGIFAIALSLQLKTPRFNPMIYWFTIIATTTLGTTLADFADRSLGVGYAGGSALLLVLLLTTLWLWQSRLGSVAIASITKPQAELFYWLTIMFSQTLGTALGDWVADTEGLGYLYSAIIFSSALGLLAVAYGYSSISRTLLFWAAFILTRPLGAVLGDFLDKPIAEGGLELSRYSASLALFVAMAVLIIVVQGRNSTTQT